MNQEQLVGMLRVVIPAACMWLASQGFSFFGDAGVVAQIVAALIAVVAVGYSFVAHTNAAKLASAAAVDPKVKILVPDHVAKDDEKVAALVANPAVPNVTSLNAPGAPPNRPASPRK